MLKSIWNDDGGALLSAEWVFMATIIVIGLVTGLVQVRNAVVGELAEVAGAVSGLDQTYGYVGLFKWYNAIVLLLHCWHVCDRRSRRSSC